MLDKSPVVGGLDNLGESGADIKDRMLGLFSEGYAKPEGTVLEITKITPPLTSCIVFFENLLHHV